MMIRKTLAGMVAGAILASSTIASPSRAESRWEYSCPHLFAEFGVFDQVGNQTYKVHIERGRIDRVTIHPHIASGNGQYTMQEKPARTYPFSHIEMTSQGVAKEIRVRFGELQTLYRCLPLV